MPQVLLRLGKYRAAWESRDVSQIVKRDFRLRDGSPDLRPSVYAIDGEADDVGARAIRVHAEHTASFLEPPHRGAPSLDAAGLLDEILETRGDTEFEFANSCHREVVLADERALQEFVSSLVDERASREIRVTHRDLLAHVRSAAHSEEWTRAASANPKVAKWIAAAIKKGPT